MTHRALSRRPAIRLTALGFGAAQGGNLYRATTDDDVRRARSTPPGTPGIRYFDTAPHYGLGLSERRLGAALRTRPRDEYVISTKVGRLLVPIARDRATGATRRASTSPADPPPAVGLQPRRRAPLARGEPGPHRPRPDRHRVPARPRRPLAAGRRRRRARPGRAARPGRHRRRRRGHEPVGDARPVRPGDRHRPGDVRRPVHPARPGRAATTCCPPRSERGSVS